MLANWVSKNKTKIFIILGIIAIGCGLYFGENIKRFGTGGIPTRFQPTLSATITSTADSFRVSSASLPDGSTLSSSTALFPLYPSINPGASTEEILECYGFSGTTFFNCGRGLGFTTTGNATSTQGSGARFAHSAGEKVIMSNVAPFFLRFLDRLTNQSVTGEITFSASTTIFLPNVVRVGDNAAGNKTLFARNGDTDLPFLRYDDTQNLWLASNNGVDTYQLTPTSSVVSAGRGAIIESSVISVATTTSRHPGLRFWLESGRLRLAAATSTATGGSSLVVDAEGLLFNASTTAYSGLRFNSAGALEFTGQVQSLNLLTGNYISASSSAVTSTFSNVVFNNNIVAPTIMGSATAASSSATTTIRSNLYIHGNLIYDGSDQSGAKWEFLGSATGLTPAVPAGSRAAITYMICNTTANPDPAGIRGEVTAFVTGKTIGGFLASETGTATGYCGFTVSWSAPATYTITDNTSAAGSSVTLTTYFFR